MRDLVSFILIRRQYSPGSCHSQTSIAHSSPTPHTSLLSRTNRFPASRQYKEGKDQRTKEGHGHRKFSCPLSFDTQCKSPGQENVSVALLSHLLSRLNSRTQQQSTTQLTQGFLAFHTPSAIKSTLRLDTSAIVSTEGGVEGDGELTDAPQAVREPIGRAAQM